MSPFTIFLIAFAALFIALLIPCLIWYIPWYKKKKAEEKQNLTEKDLQQNIYQQIQNKNLQTHEAMQEKYGMPLSVPAALVLALPAEDKRDKLETFVKQVRKFPPCLLEDTEKWENAPHVTAEQINPFALFTLFRNGDDLILMECPKSVIDSFFSDLKKARAVLPEFEKVLASEKENEENPGAVKQSPSEISATDSAIIKYWSVFPYLETTNARLLSVNDVAYFTIAVTSAETNTHTTYTPFNNTTVTNTKTDAKRTATLYFNFNCNLQPLQVSDTYLDDRVSRLEAMLPEKRK